MIDAAAAVLRETGDENGLSIRDVALRVRVTRRRSIRISNKEALVYAVLRLRDATTGVPDPAVSLRAGCLAYLRLRR